MEEILSILNLMGYREESIDISSTEGILNSSDKWIAKGKHIYIWTFDRTYYVIDNHSMYRLYIRSNEIVESCNIEDIVRAFKDNLHKI